MEITQTLTAEVFNTDSSTCEWQPLHLLHGLQFCGLGSRANHFISSVFLTQYPVHLQDVKEMVVKVNILIFEPSLAVTATGALQQSQQVQHRAQIRTFTKSSVC